MVPRSTAIIYRVLGAALVVGGVAFCSGALSGPSAQSSPVYPPATSGDNTTSGNTTHGNTIVGNTTGNVTLRPDCTSGNTFGNTVAFNTVGNTVGNTGNDGQC